MARSDAGVVVLILAGIERRTPPWDSAAFAAGVTAATAGARASVCRAAAAEPAVALSALVVFIIAGRAPYQIPEEV